MDGTWRLEPLGTDIQVTTRSGPSGECGTEMTMEGSLGPRGGPGDDPGDDPGAIRLRCDQDGGYVGFGADGTVLQLSGTSTPGGLDVAERLTGTLHRPPEFTSADGQSKSIPVTLTFEAAAAGQSSCLCRQVAEQAALWEELHDLFARRDLIDAALAANAPAYTRDHGWQRQPDGLPDRRSYDPTTDYTYYDMIRQEFAGPTALPDPNTGGGTPDGGNVYSPANTDPDTCEVLLPLARTPGGVCDPRPLVRAAELHEGRHQQQCLSMLDQGTGRSDYAWWVNYPPNLAKDEMRAYRTAVDTAEDWLDVHCRN